MSNKTISINPSLFSLGGSKTKKNRVKKPKSTAVPLISPNVLKNKLLKRIKEHKQRETENLENNKRKLNTEYKPEFTEKKQNDEFSDEFTDSINYLQTLSKQKRIDDEKKNYELIKQKRKEELERRTIRNYHSMDKLAVSGGTPINMDLPEELNQPFQTPIITEPYKINSPYKGDEIPYGVLKGGLKPSYREWARTHRNNEVTNPKSSLIIQGGYQTSEKTARENRLNLLKEKLKNKIQENTVDPMISENLIKKSLSINPSITTQYSTQQPAIKPSIQSPIKPLPTSEQINDGGSNIIATKHITKKTIKRKYTLGRSKIKKTVGVLIKDRGTRKRVLTAQKDLKKRNINDIKMYLRDHNLIKAGSNAPNDVLRKLYESAMLAGEISNSNVDTLLYNFSKDDTNN